MAAFLALYRSLLYNRMWKTADWLVNHFSTLSLKYNVHFNYLNALNFWMVSNILLAPTFLFENVSLISFCDSALWEQSNINLFKPRLEENISIRNYVSKKFSKNCIFIYAPSWRTRVLQSTPLNEYMQNRSSCPDLKFPV